MHECHDCKGDGAFYWTGPDGEEKTAECESCAGTGYDKGN
jgi:hypothetical protein